MSGIAGWIHKATTPSEQRTLVDMIDSMEHRGPDGRGVFFASTSDRSYSVGLAHRRLAILDRTSGEQPMYSQDGAYIIVFDGEIYNFESLRQELTAAGHVFTTRSDTEVLLMAYIEWGADCVTRLRGMFAFALWDRKREQLFLARDRFGKKPLFLWQGAHGTLVFASEIRALLRHPSISRQLDRASVLDYLQYRYVPGYHTLFKGIVKLPPAHYAIYKNGSLKQARYYQPPDAAPGTASFPQKEKAPAAFLKVLNESIRMRMIADVPYGVFFSGGLDSSALVALMSRQSSSPVHTFSIGFREYGAAEQNRVREIAQKLKTKHHDFTMPAADIISLLPAAIAYRGGPLSDPADIALYSLSQHACSHVKMVLTGEGADEVLAGHEKYRFEPYAQMYHRFVPAFLQKSSIPAMLARRMGKPELIAIIECLNARDAQVRMRRWAGALSNSERNELMLAGQRMRPVFAEPFNTSRTNSAMRNALYYDQMSYLPDNLLERSDRMTMAASIQVRMPYLDHALVAFVSSCPDEYRVYKGTQKWLLREAMKNILPEEALAQPKGRFNVPIDAWFRSGLREYVHDHLLSSASLTRDYYKPGKIRHYLGEHESGTRNHEKLIWALLNLELFQREYRLH